jgi:hypothetical protein
MLAATAAFAQNGALQTNETARVANERAAAAKAAPLIEADKKRPRIGGYWVPEKKVDALLGADGKTPAMTAEGKKLYKERTTALARGKADDPNALCVPPGIPRDMISPGPMLITQTPAKITMFHEFRHLIRHAFLEGPFKADEELDPWWQGHTTAYWDGDVLVMETKGFNGKLWADNTGLPQSPAMKVVERFKLLDPNTLEDVITIDDSKYYPKPWTTRLTFKHPQGDPEPTFVIRECGEALLEFPMTEYAPPAPR